MPSAPFLPTTDLATFCGKPGNRVYVGRSFCTWRVTSGAHGSISWGKPADRDVAEMCRVFDAILHSPLAGHPSIIDTRSVESLSIDAFELLVKTLTERRGDWHPRAGRQALVHSAGFSGALVLGALQMTAAEYELRFFEDPREAFGWAGAASVAPDVAALRASLLEPADVVRRVRVALDGEKEPVCAAQLARALGLSTRSLQRHLAAAGTSIRAERAAHLLARAERLLEGTDHDLAAIAAMLGLSSAARLVALFRAERNTTPGEWRRAATSRRSPSASAGRSRRRRSASAPA